MQENVKKKNHKIKGQAENPTFLHTCKSFLKIIGKVFCELKICLHVDEVPNHIEKPTFARVDKAFEYTKYTSLSFDPQNLNLNPFQIQTQVL